MYNLSDVLEDFKNFIRDKYIILPKDEYENLLKEKTERESLKAYPEVAIGVPDLFDDPADIEITNTPVYYIPVGDGLYRPTYSKATFLGNACDILYKCEMVNKPFGTQFKFLIDHGFLPYDLCLALKSKEKDMLFMIGKDNDELPFYVKSAWNRCFGPKCEWHPLCKKEKEEQEELTKQGIRELKKAFAVDPDEEAKPHRLSCNPDDFNCPPFVHHATREYTTEPIDFKKYPNTLIVFTKSIGGRGKPMPSYNTTAITDWLRQYGPKGTFPFTTMKDFAMWLRTIPISFTSFWKMFRTEACTINTKLTLEMCEAVNQKFGITILALPGSVPTKTNTKSNQNDVIKNTLVLERKYSIRTLSHLFKILEKVVDRQVIIDVFHITEDELTHPSNLNTATATFINKYCSKQICFATRK